MRNASENRLLSFLNEVELMTCNGRKLVSEPEWTRVSPSLKQKSVIDYIITQVFPKVNKMCSHCGYSFEKFVANLFLL